MVKKFQFSNGHVHLRDIWKLIFFPLKFKVLQGLTFKLQRKTKEIARIFESHSKGTKNGGLWGFQGNNSKVCWGLVCAAASGPKLCSVIKLFGTFYNDGHGPGNTCMITVRQMKKKFIREKVIISNGFTFI